MELRQIRYFRAVAQAGHFRTAATRLNVAQPALSHQIQQLERELGVRLFDRTSRIVKLTAVGELLLSHADRIMMDVELASEQVAEFRGTVRGDLRIGILPMLGVEAFRISELLSEFSAMYPHTRTAVREAAATTVHRWLQEGEVHLAFTLFPSSGELPPGVQAVPFLTSDVVVVAAAGHPLATRPCVDIADLRNERFVVFRTGAVTRGMLVEAARASGFQADVAFEVGGAQLLRDLAGQGLAIAVVPRWCFLPHDPPLACIELAPPRPTVTVAVEWFERFERAPAVVAFLELAQQRLVGVPGSDVRDP